MNYYADTTWNITFHNEAAKDAAKHALTTTCGWEFTAPFKTGDDHWLDNIGDDADEYWDDLDLSGSTTGRLYGDLPDAIAIIAAHADGEIELDASASNDGHSKYVLANGTARLVQGTVTYHDTRSPWDEIDGHPVADWRYEVANDDTRLGYLAWADARQRD